MWEVAHPLGLVLLPALGNSDGIAEDAVILPELELSERGPASEEIQDRGHNGPLIAAELDARCGLDVSALELELANVAGRHSVLLCWR